MTTIYEIGDDGIWTGATREIDDAEGVRGNWTRSAPPAAGEGEYTRWQGSRWHLVTAEILSAEAGERLKTQILAAAQAQLDAFAATRGYDGILSACTYATSTVTKFAAEGAYCVMLRDQTWAALYQMLAEVEAGTRPIPAGFDDIAGELPTAGAEWPD